MAIATVELLGLLSNPLGRERRLAARIGAVARLPGRAWLLAGAAPEGLAYAAFPDAWRGCWSKTAHQGTAARDPPPHRRVGLCPSRTAIRPVGAMLAEQ